MISIRFHTSGDFYSGFSVEGHSGHAPAGEDIICAAVSAAVGLAECALTDVLCTGADIDTDEDRAYVSIRLKKPNRDTQIIIKALYLYFSDLYLTYPKNISFSEV